ncbi:Uncharacterised protein [Vibrio cholerae]|nr:Uncharacterised protein [Vibrio cholerae]
MHLAAISVLNEFGRLINKAFSLGMALKTRFCGGALPHVPCLTLLGFNLPKA